jgi:hypothetical protein
MPRASLGARAAHRGAAVLALFPYAHENYSSHLLKPDGHTCPYCSKTLKSPWARDRHILLKPVCRERHLYALKRKVKKRRKRKRKDEDTNLGERQPKQARPEPVPDLPMTSRWPGAPLLEDNRGRSASEDGLPNINERVCGDPYVENFPISTAGAPISSETRPAPDLEEYLRSCGSLGDPKLFKMAELLMMTVPKSKD